LEENDSSEEIDLEMLAQIARIRRWVVRSKKSIKLIMNGNELVFSTALGFSNDTFSKTFSALSARSMNSRF